MKQNINSNLTTYNPCQLLKTTRIIFISTAVKNGAHEKNTDKIEANYATMGRHIALTVQNKEMRLGFI